MSNFAPDYVDVAERLRLLAAKYPDASMQGSYTIIEVAGTTRVVYRAECYRTPDDLRPGIGYAWEEVPGKTPFTKDSELMNAETSAWGRAIVAALAAEAKRVATVEEIQHRRPQRPQSSGDQTTPASRPRASSAAKEPVATGTPASAPDVRATPAGGATAGEAEPSTASPAISQNQMQRVQSKAKLAKARELKFADERERRGLPLLKDCNSVELDAFEAMLDGLLAESEPFAVAK